MFRNLKSASKSALQITLTIIKWAKYAIKQTFRVSEQTFRASEQTFRASEQTFRASE